MKKLTPEEFSDIPLLSKGKTSPFYLGIIGLKKGERLIISKEEWNLSGTPGRICCYIMKKFPQVKYYYGKKYDKSGWEVRRVE